MARRSLFTFIVLGLVACSNTASRGPNAATVQQGGVEYRLETTRSSYTIGEVAELIYTITNTTPGTVQLGMVPNCEYCTAQFHARRADQEVWCTCRVIPPCGHVEFSLAAGETRQWVEDWALTNDHGTMEPEDDSPLEQGTYTIVAELYLSSTADRVPVSIQIGIK